MDFYDYKNFLKKFFAALVKTGIDYSGLNLDHIAYKSETIDHYYKIKPEFERFGKLFHEVGVRGQKVAMFKLEEPWKYKGYSVKAIELVSAKEGEGAESGWEHAEFLLNESFDDFMMRYPKLEWDTSAMNSEDFPMIKLKLEGGLRVKFPKRSILETP